MDFHAYNRFAAVVTSDTVDFVRPPLAIYVGGTGNIIAVNGDGSTVTLSAVPVGTLLPISPRRINATSTTATLMVAFFVT